MADIVDPLLKANFIFTTKALALIKKIINEELPQVVLILYRRI